MDEFLTVAEVAELLGCSRRTVFRMIHAGALPAVRVGHLLRVKRDSFERSQIIVRGEH